MVHVHCVCISLSLSLSVDIAYITLSIVDISETIANWDMKVAYSRKHLPVYLSKQTVPAENTGVKVTIVFMSTLNR